MTPTASKANDKSQGAAETATSRKRNKSGLAAALRDPKCLGVDSIHLVGKSPWWQEFDLPFTLHGGGALVRLEPGRGFSKQLLVGDEEELSFVQDAPDGGWLLPQAFVAAWMDRHVRSPRLDDVVLTHPVYQHLVKPDAKGRSRIGRGSLVHWTPGVPTVAAIRGPELLNDARAPSINRERAEYIAGVLDLAANLKALGLEEISFGLSYTP